MNEENKIKISNHLFRCSPEQLINNLLNSNGIQGGLKFINYFTGHERLNTIGRININFYDFCHKIDDYCDKEWFIRLVTSARNNNKNIHVIGILRNIFNLYFGSIGVFLPSYTNNIFSEIKPSCVLDFTMGWGGRLVSACKCGIKKYIGIDNNQNLKQPYENMVEVLNIFYSTEIELLFEDCLKIDYSKLDYDCVMTSPPYYNIELYSNTQKKTKKEWINNFYIPIIMMTFNNMKKGGYYCLNVNKKMYDDFLFDILGYYDGKHLISSRTRNEEFIYIWRKN